MSNPTKPERLRGERLEEIRNRRPDDWWDDEEIRDLLQEVDALTAELEERTRERDEAVAVVVSEHADSIGDFGLEPGSCSYRSGLLRAARRASAMAGKLDHKAGKTDIIDGRCHVWLEAGCPKCALLTLAAKLREEAGEG